MSDSLRDQLLKAGFTQSAKADSGKKGSPGKKRQSANKNQPKRTDSARKAEKKKSSQRVYRPEDSLEKERLKKIRYRSIAPTSGSAPTKKAKKAPAVKARSGSWSSRSTVVDAGSESSRELEEQTPQSAENTQPDGASIEALVQNKAVHPGKPEQLFRFSMRNRISEIQVASTIRESLIRAELGIVSLQGKLVIVSADAIEDIKRIHPELAVFLASDPDRPADTPDDTDYDDFPIPDDLHW